METKVFRAEVLKPTNYTWEEFGAIVAKTMYYSAQLANEAISLQYLIAKGQLERNGDSFCSLVQSCKERAISGAVKCSICQLAKKKFNASARVIMRGDVSLPTFKNNSAYIKSSGTKLSCNQDGEWVVRLSLLPKSDGRAQPEVMLRTKEIERTSPGYYQILGRIADSDYKLGNMQLKRDKIRGKLYLLISYSFEPEREDGLNADRVMGVDLGVATPAYCAFNDSLKRKSLLAEGKKLLATKRAIEGRRRDVLRDLSKRDRRRGHGLSGKYHSVRPLESRWDNFRRTWNHTLAKRIVEYGVANQAGMLHLEDLSTNGQGGFLGRHWPVHELLALIEQKATEQGVKVLRVNPYKTSQTCSRCGTIAENFNFKERSKNGFPSFVCGACGFEDNADYNAAKNISKTTCERKPRKGPCEAERQVA